MKTIWKFPMSDWNADVEMPKGARVLTVQMQGVFPTLWAEVESDAPKVVRRFTAIGTGHTMPSGLRAYVGTVQRGDLVWHFYERE